MAGAFLASFMLLSCLVGTGATPSCTDGAEACPATPAAEISESQAEEHAGDEAALARTALLQHRVEKSAGSKTCPQCNGGKCHCAWATAKKCAGPGNGSCCRKCCCDEFPHTPQTPAPTPKPAAVGLDRFDCEEQMDLGGIDLEKPYTFGKGKATDMALCSDKCVDYYGHTCKAIVYSSDGQCWLKGEDSSGEIERKDWWFMKNFGATRTSCKLKCYSWVEGGKACDHDIFDCEEQMDYAGRDLASESFSGLLGKLIWGTDKEKGMHLCSNKCLHYGDECKAFVYDSNDKCWIIGVDNKGEIWRQDWWLGKNLGRALTSCKLKTFGNLF